MSRYKTSPIVFSSTGNAGVQISHNFDSIVNYTSALDGDFREILAPSNAEVDIVFVSTSTYPYVTREGSESHAWGKALQQDGFPPARLFTFEHANIMDDDSDALEHYSHLLMRRVASKRQEFPNRPLIWVAHSLSGMVVEKALGELQGGPREQIKFATKGICFLGTPHRSSSIAGWATVLMACSEVFKPSRDSSKLGRRAQIFRNHDIEQLAAVSARFRESITADMAILSVLETRRTTTSSGDALIVSSEYGQLRHPNETIQYLNCNHRDLLDFMLSEEGYETFEAFVIDILRRVQTLKGDQSPSLLRQSTAVQIQSYRLPRRTTTVQSTGSGHKSSETVESSQEEDEQAEIAKLADDWLEESAVPSRHPGTCSWLLDTAEWQKWLKEKEVFFLQGDSGSGKTVFAKFVAQELRNLAENLDAHHSSPPESVSASQEITSSQRRLVLVYFFDYAFPARRTFTGFLRSMLYQLASLQPSLFQVAQLKRILTSQKWYPALLMDSVLTAILHHTDATGYDFVIDGMDECAPNDQEQLMTFVQRLGHMANIRFFLTSQPQNEASRVSMAQRTQRLNLREKRDEISRDIHSFITAKLDALALKGKWPDTTRAQVSRKLHGMDNFLCVKVILGLLKQERRTRGINEILEHTRSRVRELIDYSMDKARRLEQQDTLASLYFLIAAERSLTSSELSTLLALAHYREDVRESERREGPRYDMNGIVDEYTFDLLSVTQHGQPLLRSIEGKIMVLHKEVDLQLRNERNTQKLFKAWNRTPESMPRHDGSDISEIHSFLAEACLTYLLAAFTAERDSLDFLGYSWQHWASHLRQARNLSRMAYELVSELSSQVFGLNESKLQSTLSAAGVTFNLKLFPANGRAIHVLAAFDAGEALRDLRKGTISRHTKSDAWLDVTDELQRTPLHLAAGNNSVHTIPWLLREYKKENPQRLQDFLVAKDQAGLTAIHYAIASDLVEATSLLLDFLESRTKLERPLLSADQDVKSVEMLRCLWDRRDQTVQLSDALLLRAAIRFGESSIVSELLTPQALATMPQQNAEAVLFAAITAGSYETIKNLLQQNPMNVARRDENGRTPLHTAVSVGIVEVVKYLLDREADPDSMDSKGQTPLHIAAFDGHSKIAQLLLDHGSDILFVDAEGNQPLHLAAKGSGNLDLCQLFLDRAADVDRFDREGRTPLHLAAIYNHPKLVQLLLEHGADANALDLGGETPLHKASSIGNMAAIMALLENGATPDTLSAHSQSPLHFAIDAGYLEVAEALLRSGADPDLPDVDGKTPVQLAYKAKRNSDRMVTLLLTNGARARRRELEPKHYTVMMDQRASEGSRDQDRERQISDLTLEIGRLREKRERISKDNPILSPSRSDERQLEELVRYSTQDRYYIPLNRSDDSERRVIRHVTSSSSRSQSMAGRREIIFLDPKEEYEPRTEPPSRRRRRYLSAQ